jgi:hypothetical protein
MNVRSSIVGLPWRRLLLIGPPVLLGILFFIHPDGSGGHETLLSVGDTWLFLHVAMLPLLGLFGGSLFLLLDGYAGPVATIGRVGVGIYLTFYVAFEAIAGVVTGLLTHKAHTVPAEQQAGVAAAIDSLVVPSLMLGFVGTVGAFIAVISIGILLRRSGAPLLPVFLLGGAPLATLFHSGTPIDAIAMFLFVGGIVWLELRWQRDDERGPWQIESGRSVEQ